MRKYDLDIGYSNAGANVSPYVEGLVTYCELNSGVILLETRVDDRREMEEKLSRLIVEAWARSACSGLYLDEAVEYLDRRAGSLLDEEGLVCGGSSLAVLKCGDDALYASGVGDILICVVGKDGCLSALNKPECSAKRTVYRYVGSYRCNTEAVKVYTIERASLEAGRMLIMNRSAWASLTVGEIQTACADAQASSQALASALSSIAREEHGSRNAAVVALRARAG